MNTPQTTEKKMDLCVKCGKSIDVTPRPILGFPFPIMEIPANICERCQQLRVFPYRHLMPCPYKPPRFRPRPDEPIPGRYEEHGAIGGG